MRSRCEFLRAILKSSAAALGAILAAASPALANPLDGYVSTGAASISNAANATTVKQSSEGVVIDWSSFNVGKDETATFVQPNANAIAVNRIGGHSASQIFGTLDANGRIVLINGNGLLFGKGSQVNVGSLVATSTDADNKNALAGKFNKPGSASATIVNDGKITAGRGGLVALVAFNVSNSGTINAKLGTVALGGADKFTVDFNGDGLVSFAAHGANPGQATNAGVLKGASVTLTARSAEGLAAGVVNAGGIVEASAAKGVGGDIVLDAGYGGNIDISGNLDASGKLGGGSISTNSAAANLSVEKSALLSADATHSGDGGRITLAASGNTDFAGHISAQGAGATGKGGSAEVSGHGTLSFTGLANLKAANGTAGSLTLDPSDYFINSTGVSPEPKASAISATTLESELASANVELVTRNGGSQNGDFTVAANVSWSSPYRLVLEAYRNIIVDTGVTMSSTGGGSVYLEADRKYTGTGAVTFDGTGSLHASGGGSVVIFYDPTSYDNPVSYSSAVTVSGGGTSTAYMRVNTLANLQAIGADATTLAGDYVLSQDIDASATSAWNGGEGFVPIGSSSTLFTGVFYGQNHTISGLTIDLPSGDDVGLFGDSYGNIENVGLINANITGDQYVGALLGEMYLPGVISKSYASGSVVGQQFVGGLIGYARYGTISRDFATATVNSSGSTAIAVGGLVGAFNSSITDSYASGDVFGGESVGGLVGTNGGTILRSDATGSVTGTEYVGGLIGENEGTVRESFATGDVTGNGNDVGGFTGFSGDFIYDSYATGTVNGAGATNVGGFVGNTEGGVIKWSYESGSVIGGYGFVGNTIASSRYVSDYWDTSNNLGLTGSPSDSASITGLTTAQFQSGIPSGFSNTTWGSNPTINNGFPYLLELPPS